MASIFSRMAAGANRLAHAWNTFSDQEQQKAGGFGQYGVSYGTRPDRRRMQFSNEKSIVSAVYTRLGVDTASVDIRHIRLDDKDQYTEDMPSGLNSCLTLEANIDQAARAFRQDVATTMFEKGVVAVVPVDTNFNPDQTGGYDILTMRAGEVIQWYPRHVKVRLWNDKLGRHEDITVSKSSTAIVENPFYSVMNETNSTLQRLIRKLNILDAVDEASSSGKLDLIIQLPYVIKTQARKVEAEARAKDIEMQLKGSKYGIAYTDGTEKITQLNRPAENNLLGQIEFLTKMLYSQLGLTEDIFSGAASEQVMLNYHNRTIDPVLAAITEAMRRTFLTKTARTQGQTIRYFRDPFKLVAVSAMADIADKFSRNEIFSPNEIRGFMGVKPSKDPKADQLVNSNMPQPAPVTPTVAPPVAASVAPTKAELLLKANLHKPIPSSPTK